jgi:hypothetical protein
MRLSTALLVARSRRRRSLAELYPADPLYQRDPELARLGRDEYRRQAILIESRITTGATFRLVAMTHDYARRYRHAPR